MRTLMFVCCCMLSSICSKAYWQQHVATTIRVVLDDENHFLNGFEKIVYTNNSPDTLSNIYIHLWPNAYRNDRTKFCEQLVSQGKTDFYFSSEKDRGFIDSFHFSVDNEKVGFEYWDGNIDVAKIQLPQPLLPGKFIIIETPFRVKIPKVFSRLGHTGQAYFISQWFPKPAVYDDKGWHPLPYLDQGEFYSEFGSYDVTIQVPENYIVMATGNCQSESETIWLDSLSKLAAPPDTLYRNTFPKSNSNFKTIRFTEDNIHDFAWFADKRWILRQDSISGEGNIGVAKLYTAFLPVHQKEWATANEMLKSTIRLYGSSVGRYPYQTIKAVEGDMSAGGGMEYPTVTIIDKTVASELPAVISHEAGHNWFYGMLGSNERLNPWMDEGSNSFYEFKFAQSLKDSFRNSPIQKLESSFYNYQALLHRDQPSVLAADEFLPINYGMDVYFKTGKLLQWLEAYIGQVNFEKGMKAYFEEFQFKHPAPEDFRRIMQMNSTKNLDWFFDGALKTSDKIDFKFQSVRNKRGQSFISIKNNAQFPAPVLLSIYEKDSLLNEQWLEPFSGDTTIESNPTGNWSIMKLNTSFAEFKISNNEYRRNGLFHKGGLKVKPVLGLNYATRNTVFLSPSLGYNAYDGFGLGLLLHNVSLPQNRFQFAIAPLYSFGSKNINGLAAVSYSWYPRRFFQEVRLQTNLKSFSLGTTTTNIPEPIFARYFKIAASLEFVFKENSLLSKIERKLIIRQYNIKEEYFVYTQNPVDSLYRPLVSSEHNTYGLIRFQHSNKRTFHPFGYSTEAQFGKDFIKLGLDANARIDYDVKNKSFYIRAYAGKFITTNAAANTNRYWLNTAYSGTNDYLYDGTYLARNKNEGLLSKQVSMQEGGFKTPTNLYSNPLGRSDDWLISLNFKTDLPFRKLPIRFYADISTFADAKRQNPDGNAVSFAAGLELHLFRDCISIYAPLIMSTDYSNYLSEMYSKQKFLNSISFSFNIQHFNWLRSNEEIFKILTR
ncbi:MAG: M1 family metallopeptidase [Chitinophagaceae bacterium]